MRINDQDWSIGEVIRAFFPFQLVFSHLKHNIISLVFWGILFAAINDSWGIAFGAPYLFLSPEYLNEISFASFLLLGFALGGFIMGFNTYSYIRLGPWYPFLITLNKPFFKFCINNGLIPLVFIINFIINMAIFQYSEEYASFGSILLFAFGFLLGVAIFMALSWLFFFRLIKYNPYEDKGATKPFKTMTYQNDRWYDIFKIQKEYRSLYIGKNFKIKASRSSKHFDKELVQSIFAKNRVSASIYEINTILIFFGLGFFNGFEVFEVPAATSVVLLFTICLMLYSALHSWLKGWAYAVIIGALILMNYLSHTSKMFHYTSYAYGLDYSKQKRSEYSLSLIQKLSENKKINDETFEQFTSTLNNWKKRTQKEKPKLIIIKTSGGGSRSALWTTVALLELDKRTNNQFFKHTQMITGASGGMIGAAYYRETVLERQLNPKKKFTEKQVRDNIGKDILNKLLFMASTNDIFVRYQNVEYGGHSYTKDRGSAFEEQLLDNTEESLNHKLGYYSKYESDGIIPTMVFTPTIVNDGRRLFISSNDLNFLASGSHSGTVLGGVYENIDIHGILPKQNIDNLRFSTVLRASATFPFIMPMITMPTSPEIQLMDAGIRDNYGTKTIMLYLHSLQEWIKENTSGVIIIEIRDTKKIYTDEKFLDISFIDKLTLPFGNMYKNFPRAQSYDQEELLALGVKSLDFPIDLVPFNLIHSSEERISLSWHLTKAEKLKIANAIHRKENQKSMNKIKELLNEK